MIERDRIDNHEVSKVVLIGNIVTKPSYDIKWGMTLHNKQYTVFDGNKQRITAQGSSQPPNSLTCLKGELGGA